ncbi:hypothetical protein [Nocardioides sp.]|uniref:hypothetical protein n=1 Tax=Nocardioides sp. TaxID=35761 RepID=UPI002B274784|nr:hypothetical protein [Nocardioides sp.]
MSEEQHAETWDDDSDVMLERPAATGLPRIDAVVDAVASMGSVDLSEHVRVYEQAHRELRSALDDPDAAAAVVESA